MQDPMLKKKESKINSKITNTREHSRCRMV